MHLPVFLLPCKRVCLPWGEQNSTPQRVGCCHRSSFVRWAMPFDVPCLCRIFLRFLPPSLSLENWRIPFRGGAQLTTLSWVVWASGRQPTGSLSTTWSQGTDTPGSQTETDSRSGPFLPVIPGTWGKETLTGG